jgi:AbrB family looped-hinge helix DNA binding protein
MLQTIKISPKGQIAIPKKFRDKLELHESTQVYLTENKGKLVIGKVDDIIPKNISQDWTDEIARNSSKQLKDIWDNEREEKIWSQYK